MRWHIVTIVVLFLSLLPLVGCETSTESEGWGPITVFAAASLTDAFTELGVTFSAEHPGSVVTFNFAGSNQLATQIAEGAPADVFASANESQMAAVVAGGRVDPADPVTFATNRLVVIFPNDNPANLTRLEDLANEGVLLLLAASEVPVGQYSLDFLIKAGQDPRFGPMFAQAVLANLVSSEQNVRAVLTKVALGEADAGIVYATDVAAAGQEVGRLDIPDELNTIAMYPIAILNDSGQPASARAFVDFVLSEEGQTILARHGFNPVVFP